jgi:hypothetical protein
VKLHQPGSYPWPDIAPAELYHARSMHFDNDDPDAIKFGHGREEGAGFSRVTPPEVEEAVLTLECKPSLPTPERRSVTLMLRAACTGLVSEPKTVSKDTPLHVGGMVLAAGGNPYEIRTVIPLSEVLWNLVMGGISRFPAGSDDWFKISWPLLRGDHFRPVSNEEWSFFLSRVTQEPDDLPGPLLVRNVHIGWQGKERRPIP